MPILKHKQQKLVEWITSYCIYDRIFMADTISMNSRTARQAPRGNASLFMRLFVSFLAVLDCGVAMLARLA
jgi:hypothetical protein